MLQEPEKLPVIRPDDFQLEEIMPVRHASKRDLNLVGLKAEAPEGPR